MRSGTGLAATLRSLLHELGISPRTARPTRPTDGSDERQPPNPAAVDTEGQMEQSAPESLATAKPVCPTPDAPDMPPADETPATGAPPVPSVPAAAKPKAAGKFLRRVQTAALWLRDVGLGAGGYILLVVVATAGFTASFIGLHLFGMDQMHYSDHQAWLVPTAIDGADIGLSVTALRAAMAGRSAFLNRLMIFACTAISSWVNYEHIPDWYGRRIAALLPILAVILLEFLLGEARAAHERRLGQQRPRLSLLRWAFDFRGTTAILRAYVLGIPLPDQMAEAAAVVEEEKAVSKPRGRRPRSRRPKATAPKSPEAPGEPERPQAENPDSPMVDGGRAPVIDIGLVRKYGEKSAHAITVWLDSVKAGAPLSFRRVDQMIKANGTAKFAINRYIADYGDPRVEAANE